MVREHWDYEALRRVLYMKYKDGSGKIKTTNINNIFAFDIETSSGYLQEDGCVIPFDHKIFNDNYLKNGRLSKPEQYSNPVAVMYIWQCAVENGNDIDVFFGRTWDEFESFISKLDDTICDYVIFGNPNISNCDNLYRSYALGKDWKKPVVHFYVHNLGFEFQFLRNIFSNRIAKVFSRTMRKPMRFLVKYDHIDILFHDTLCLTQKSLANWAKDSKLSIQKLKGDLDYNVIRNSMTPLTRKELDYCVNDVALMIEGIQQYRKKYNNKLSDIPMTQTGTIRQICREEISDKCVFNGKLWAEQCYEIDKSYSFDFFNKLVTAFAGGWTHANEKYSGKLQRDIVCWDFASSYPSVLTSCKFALTKFREVDAARIEYLMNTPARESDYRYLIVVELYNVESRMWNTYFSQSKCIEIDEDSMIIDNGKVVATDYMKVCITDVDWEIIRKAYDIVDYKIVEAYEADAGYLPKEFIRLILKQFGYKTSLKGTGNDSLYNEAKQFVNSIYGVSCQRILSLIVEFDGEEWSKHEPTLEEFDKLMKIPEKYSTKLKQVMKKFITYQIGVWVTAFARMRLWDAIFEFDSKVVYCDTDSVKGHFTDNDIKWFEDYNNGIAKIQNDIAIMYGFNSDEYCPLTADGERKRLGIFEREADCVEFKALRAKVYAAKHWNKKKNDYEVETTIAGLPKASGVKIVKNVDDLHDDLYWTPEQSEKLCCHYLDNQPQTTWVDDYGNVEIRDDKYGIMLEPIGFDLSIAAEYKYLLMVLSNHTDVDYFNTPEIIRNYWNGIDNDEE